MIVRDHVTEWRQFAPWPLDGQVEQDLLISRSLIEIFSHEHLASSLAFRGGTALHKLFMRPSPRYSEDIDLVQTKAAPIGPLLSDLRSVLDPFLGEPKRKFGDSRVTLVYRVGSVEDAAQRMRIKVEINTREHFSVLGFTKKEFSMDSSWFTGGAEISTYLLEEILGTKLRALFQRSKGRDLFDIWYALQNSRVSSEEIVRVFHHYLDWQGLDITRSVFQKNLSEKVMKSAYVSDIELLLDPRLLDIWNSKEAFDLLEREIIPHVRGRSLEEGKDG